MEAIKKKRLKIKEGDIFTIPIDEQTQGYGQIVKIPNKHSFIMAVFEGRWDKNETVSLEEIIKKQTLFLGFTTDALLFHGRWVIVGNIISNLSSFTMPFFKLGLPSEPQKLVNYNLDEIRLATPEESKLLAFHSSSSPIGYQKALQAHYGLIEYDLDQVFQYKHLVNTLAKLDLLPN
ncbi:Imm26 family immunity protein [Mucilaginibacter sp. 10I4]|uniref:Imm26 family immunity protein n=1 Tax=Mucilaginibacter sp. 10I4 TaxID=3048580 RepID=UPI002B239CA1|nr:Imm26 family immunity protein [Mucilaginibacter sp. 10I4]